jgi:hypothetical protein
MLALQYACAGDNLLSSSMPQACMCVHNDACFAVTDTFFRQHAVAALLKQLMLMHGVPLQNWLQQLAVLAATTAVALVYYHLL